MAAQSWRPVRAELWIVPWQEFVGDSGFRFGVFCVRRWSFFSSNNSWWVVWLFVLSRFSGVVGVVVFVGGVLGAIW